jgi:hypothetical protein
MKQKFLRNPMKFFNFAEILSDSSRVQQHRLDLVSVTGFCLCFCKSLSIMLRDLQDAPAIAPKSLIFANSGAHST